MPPWPKPSPTSRPPTAPSPASPAAHKPAAPPREPSARALRYREHRIPRKHRVFVNRNLRMTQDPRHRIRPRPHAGALRPGRGRGAGVRPHEAEAGRVKGYPREILRVQVRPARGSSAASWSTRSAATCSRWTTSTSSRARTTASRSSAPKSGSGPTAPTGSVWATRTTSRSTPCSTCPRSISTSASSTFWSARHTGTAPDYEKVYQDVREMIDEAHRDGSLKSVITSDLDRYIRFDPEAQDHAGGIPAEREEAVPAHEQRVGLHRQAPPAHPPARSRRALAVDRSLQHRDRGSEEAGLLLLHGSAGAGSRAEGSESWPRRWAAAADGPI